MNSLPMLYRKSSKGKTQQWLVWTEGNTVLSEYGVMDGKLQTAEKICEGKNIGKANETTPEEQAISEAKAMWQKRLDTKYRKTIAETEEVVFLPMLAHDYTKLKKPIAFPADVQPKLDGVRCMAYWKDGKVQLMSRGGKVYDVEHIRQEVESFLPENTVLDGELYVHDNKLQDTIKLVKKHRDGPEGSILVEYRVYDCFEDPDTTWVMRNKLLHSTIPVDTEKVTIHPTFLVSDEDELFDYLTTFEDSGFEGVIVRTHDGLYKLGHRSKDLLKLKNFQDAEFEIVDFTQGSGRDAGTVIWICKNEDGKTFNVRPKGTVEDRKEYYQCGSLFIGSMLTVKYQALTKDKIPQFPVGIAVREPEDM